MYALSATGSTLSWSAQYRIRMVNPRKCTPRPLMFSWVPLSHLFLTSSDANYLLVLPARTSWTFSITPRSSHLFLVVTGSVPALSYLFVHSALTNREDSSSLFARIGRTVQCMLSFVPLTLTVSVLYGSRFCDIWHHVGESQWSDPRLNVHTSSQTRYSRSSRRGS